MEWQSIHENQQMNQTINQPTNQPLNQTEKHQTDFIEYPQYIELGASQGIQASDDFYKLMKSRRTIRHFSNKKIPREIIENALLTAGSAPSGANKQPWFFVVIEKTELKLKIKLAAEREEELFYNERATKQWKDDLKPFETSASKPFLAEASTLIAIFAKQRRAQDPTYYPIESTCLATGLLIASLHQAGVATLTHTPKPMGFLNDLLNLENHFRPVILLVAGYPNVPVMVPDIVRKPLNEIAVFY